MDNPRPIRLPVVVPLELDQVEAEVNAAIELVARGGARRVIVSGMPELDTLRNRWQARIRKTKHQQRKLAKALE